MSDIIDTKSPDGTSKTFKKSYAVQCNRALNGTCKFTECPHSQPHESNSKRGRGFCDVFKLEVRCVLVPKKQTKKMAKCINRSN